MMAIAEIIRKKQVESILAYNRGWVEGLAEGRIKGLAEGRIKGFSEGWLEGWAEGFAEGWVEGYTTANREWEAWLAREGAAIANGEPFDEPPPSRRR